MANRCVEKHHGDMALVVNACDGDLGVTSWVEGPIAGGHNVHPSLIDVHNHAGWDVVLLYSGLDDLEVRIFHGAQHLRSGDVSVILGALFLGPSHVVQERLCPGLGKVDMAHALPGLQA